MTPTFALFFFETQKNPSETPVHLVFFQLTDEHKLALAYGYWVGEAVVSAVECLNSKQLSWIHEQKATENNGKHLQL